MNKKSLFTSLFIAFAIGLYFFLYHRNKTLKFVPDQADIIVLIDVKKSARQSLWSLATEPSNWLKTSKSKSTISSFRKSGLKIPDFLQVFHLRNTQITAWYTVLEIDDSKKLFGYLEKHQFIKNEEKIYQKDDLFIHISGDKCLIGNSKEGFQNLQNWLLKDHLQKYFHADQFINNTVASISFLDAGKIQNFEINYQHNQIEIKNSATSSSLTSLVQKLEQNAPFLEAELDLKNISNLTQFYHKGFVDSAHISGIRAKANLEKVNDTIITYTYDDDYNEIEKRSVQKIVQPNYAIVAKSPQPEKTWEYLQNKKWINAKNQFTIIPFQPNLISKDQNKLLLQSTRNPIEINKTQNKNYLFIKNSNLLSSFFSIFNANEKKILSKIDYIFYANHEQVYFVRIKFKPTE